MSKTIRRKKAGNYFKNYYVTQLDNLLLIDGVIHSKSRWYSDWLQHSTKGRGKNFASVEKLHRWESAWYHSDMPFNQPADTYLKRLLNKRYRQESNHALKTAVREAREDGLTFLSKKVISGWLD